MIGAGDVGGFGVNVRVSMERETELLESEPSLLVLSAESENAEEPTEIAPLALLSAAGVKVAVYEVEETEFQLESEPPATETSD